MRNVLTAEHMGAAAAYDPQLKIPQRPRVRRGLAIVKENDTIVVDGGPKRQLFGGKFARESLLALLGLLDGQKDHAAIATAAGLSQDTVFKALSLLWTCGVIEEASTEGAVEDISGRLADYLSRLGDATGANATWEMAAGRLRAAHVEVFGDPDIAALVAREFESPLTVRAADGSEPSEDTTLVVVVWDETDPNRHDALIHLCWKRSLPLIRFRVAGNVLESGPCVIPGITPCLECLIDGQAPMSGTVERAELHVACALFARDVFAFISRTIKVSLPQHWRRVELDTLASGSLVGATRPGCPTCSVRDSSVRDSQKPAPAPLSALFEAAVGLPPKAFADLKAHQAHYKPANLALTRRFRTWPSSPRVDLPHAPLEWASGRSQPVRDISAEHLSLLLLLSCGIQGIHDNRVSRWTASGGNIGSVIACLIVRECSGIDPGVYAYLGEEHRLARLSSDPGIMPGTAPVTLVMIGDFPKVAQKYASFALRIVFLDAGCAQTVVHEVCQNIGLAHRFHVRWNDVALNEGLGFDLDLFPITAIIDLGDAS